LSHKPQKVAPKRNLVADAEPTVPLVMSPKIDT
jgi:hypothetical protein